MCLRFVSNYHPMSSADRVSRVLLCKHTKEVAVFGISPDAQHFSGHHGKSKRRRLLCHAGTKSPSRQLDYFEIFMLNSSFIKTRRPVTPTSLLLSFKKRAGLNPDAFGVFTAIMSSADRVRRVLLCSSTK